MSTNPPDSIPVLDHGFVAPVLQPDSDLKVVNAARVSFHKTSHWQCGCGEVPTDEPCCHQPGDYRLTDKDASLISYLATHKHWTPFAHIRKLVGVYSLYYPDFVETLVNIGGIAIKQQHRDRLLVSCSLAHVPHLPDLYRCEFNCPVSVTALSDRPPGPPTFPPVPWSEWPEETPATLHIKLPIFVDRQLVTHKVGFVRNEVSRRYVDEPPEFHVPTVWRGRPPSNIKQGSGDPVREPRHPVMTQGPEGQLLYTEQAFTPAAHMAGSVSMYNHSITQCGIAPEQARIVLPLSTYTEHWTTASLRSWARLFRLRSDPHAQLEIREYAKAIDACLSAMHPDHWPRIRDTQ